MGNPIMGLFQVITGSVGSPLGAGSPGLAPAAHLNHRPRRVVLLLAAIALMSVADLIMTVEYASSVGLFEGNPVARAVMSYGSTPLLACWKLASVGVCLWILFRTRRTGSGEFGAWVCVAALAWLSFRWTGYNAQMAEIAAAAPIVGMDMPTDRPLVTLAQ